MKVDIAQSIREVLDERQAVTIGGLGSLKLVNIPASFGELRKTILPPGVDLVLEDTTSSNSPLIENICLKYEIPPNKAEIYIQKFSETVLNTLANFGTVYIMGIGSFQRTEEGEINIIPDKDFLSQYYKGLPEIPVRLAPKQKPLSSSPVTDINTGDEIVQTQKTESTPVVLKEELPPSRSVEEDQAAIIDKTKIKPAPVLPEQKIDTTADYKTDKLKYLKTNRERGIWWPVFWIILFILLLFLLLRTCGVFSGADNNVAEPASLTDPIEIAEQSPNFSPDNEAADSEGSLVLPDQCLIITGVFSAGANIRRMDEKLRNAGFNVYHEEFGPYTRVGLSFDCDENSDLEAFIQNVRTKISAKAWYLDPVYHVDY